MVVMAAGDGLNAMSKRLGGGRATLGDWREREGRRPYPSDCPRRTDGTLTTASYAHLLGLYLVDGCLSRHRRDAFAPRRACDDAYPRLLGLPWRMPRPKALSVARREAVARLDEFVGPKS
jgi:hypothetical protein